MIHPNENLLAPAFWLSMHAGYACRDQGACCSAGWPIPIERPQAASVVDAIAAGRLRAAPEWLRVVPHQPADVAGVLALDASGACVFHGHGRCDIQTASGHAALPSCCQHFPRECVIDPRGIFVTLSHYCPTAANLLFTFRGPLEIVPGPAPVAGGAAEGLDARETLPPLLTAGVLMDHPGLTAWEAHCVSWLGGAHNPVGEWLPEQALDLLAAHAASVAAWRPGGTSLADTINRLPHAEPPAEAAEPAWREEAALRAVARTALPSPYTWPADPIDPAARWPRLQPAWTESAPVINRFLAAHAFAAWVAYQGDGIASGVRRLRLALAVLRAEVVREACVMNRALDNVALEQAIRQTDLLLVHLVDRQALASGLAGVC